jgi:hypothetical protein
MQPVTVHLPDDLLAFVQRSAEREMHPVSLQIRRYIVEAARRAGNPTASLEPWPLELMRVAGENLVEAKAQVAELTAEYQWLRTLERRSPMGSPQNAYARLRYCRDRIDALSRQIEPLKRMQGTRHGRGECAVRSKHDAEAPTAG